MGGDKSGTGKEESGAVKKTIVKILEFAAVIVALVIAVLVAMNVGVESMLRGKEEAVTLKMTEGGLPEDYIGMPAADDIPRIEDAEMWEETWATSYVTVEPIDIIATGVGARHPWVSAYTNSGRRGGPRKRADVANMALDILGEYGEYYLIKLPDESYILSQMSRDDARKLKAGGVVTLPVGRKVPSHQKVISRIGDLCEKYDVDTESVFYCINDKWNEGHNMMVLLIRLGIGAVITLVLGTVLITVIDKVLKVDRA